MNHCGASLFNISGVKDTAGILRATNTSTLSHHSFEQFFSGFGAEGGVIDNRN